MVTTPPDYVVVKSRSGAGYSHLLDRRYSSLERSLCGIRVATSGQHPVADGAASCRRCRDLMEATNTMPPPARTAPAGRFR